MFYTDNMHGDQMAGMEFLNGALWPRIANRPRRTNKRSGDVDFSIEAACGLDVCVNSFVTSVMNSSRVVPF